MSMGNLRLWSVGTTSLADLIGVMDTLKKERKLLWIRPRIHTSFGNGKRMSELSRAAEAQRLKAERKFFSPPTRFKKILKYIAFVCLALFICAGTFVGFIYMKADKLIDKIGDNTPAPVIQDPNSPEPQLPPRNANEPLTMLLLGTDFRENTGSLNTDVIMVVSLNPDTKSATLVSLPRDLIMRPEGLPERKANYYYPYFYNQDKDTANRKIKKVFSDYLKIPIDYVLTINFGGFEQVIDELGGLTIDVDQNMRYVDPIDGTNINLKKGVQRLDGKKTLDFIRYRKSNNNETPESNDLQRNQRQQQVIDKMLTKLKSIGGIIKLGQIIDVVGNNLKTDIPSAQIREMIKKYFGIDPENIHYVHPEGDWVSPYIYLHDEDLQEARKALREELGMDVNEQGVYEPAIKAPAQTYQPNPPVTNQAASDAEPSTPPEDTEPKDSNAGSSTNPTGSNGSSGSSGSTNPNSSGSSNNSSGNSSQEGNNPGNEGQSPPPEPAETEGDNSQQDDGTDTDVDLDVDAEADTDTGMSEEPAIDPGGADSTPTQENTEENPEDLNSGDQPAGENPGESSPTSPNTELPDPGTEDQPGNIDEPLPGIILDNPLGIPTDGPGEN